MGDERDMQKLHSCSAELQVHSLREDWQEDQDYCNLRGMEAEEMSYTIRRWMSSGGMLFDDSAKAKDAEEAIEQAKRMAGIFRPLINDDIRQKIQELAPGDVLSIRKPSLYFSLRVRRTKR